jgi:tetratricopeptide (TPR) repeat protein
LEKSLRYYPSSVEALNVINLIYVARGEWFKVETQSFKIMQIDYYNYYANYWLVIAFKNQAKYEFAVKASRKMLTIFPSNVTFLAELAASLYLNGEMNESKSLFDNVTVLDPNNETAKYYLKLYKK